MYRVRTVFTGVAGTPWYSNLYYDDQDPGGPEGAVEATRAFWARITTLISDLVSWTVEGDVAAISPGTGQIENMFTVPSQAGSGSDAAQPLPWATQGLARLETGAYFGGRRIRGRVFIPGPTEDESAIGVPAPSYGTLLNTAITELIGSTDASLVVYSRKNFIQTPVVAGGAAPYWAVLRSRRD